MSDKPRDAHIQYEWKSGTAPGDKRLHILAVYNDAQLHVDFVDDAAAGTRDLGRIIATMPDILTNIRRELAIRNEVAGIDDELRNLLGEGEV